MEESTREKMEEIEINARCGGHEHSNDAFDGCTLKSRFEEEPQTTAKDERQPPLTCALVAGTTVFEDRQGEGEGEGKEKWWPRQEQRR